MSLFAGNVSLRASPDEIRSFFSKFGPCRVDVKRGYAFIDYDNSRDAEDARNETNGKDFYGMKLNVEWSKKHIARTSGLAGPAVDSERRRTSRYADDRRPRDYDRDYDRDHRRRYDSAYDRDRYDRDRDYERRYRDRDDFRYDRGRDRDFRDRYDREEYGARDYRGGRGRERGRELGYERRRHEEHVKPREAPRDHGDEMGTAENSDMRRRDETERPSVERRENGNGNGNVPVDKDPQKDDELRNGPNMKTGEREEDNHEIKEAYSGEDNRRRPREEERGEYEYEQDETDVKRRRLNDGEVERSSRDQDTDRPLEKSGGNRREFKEGRHSKDGSNHTSDQEKDYVAENGTHRDGEDEEREGEWNDREKLETRDSGHKDSPESRKEADMMEKECDRDNDDDPSREEGEAAQQHADEDEEDRIAAF
ncbi:unnamed protein product [Agarophyton chilense]|eukprot:gb/GEZJ01000668.1/.p3 GENE.gb/GEZJ01000668.1/~~gb/GEZJ01000668.1/.p3  ORF type:complete len:424 (-),score=76.61 gb/GEZJ01000668.1/:6566-7837(-)